MDAAIQREETVFYAALKVEDPVQRKLFLDQACAGDAGLRSAVEELLRTQGEAERFFNDGGSAVKSVSTLPPLTGDGSRSNGIAVGDSPLEENLGTRIGRYKLLQKIGEGGCGVVYMAEQEEPVRRRVALKIIKLGMDTKSVIARFNAERQALALMDHPNIARVLDAGATETGRPYFVMELVRGIKITEFCDQNHLETDRRLDLFVQVCHAIQHAHQKGIIHRDIKPSNVMVTLHDGVPVPKVIDFGIAKATEAKLTDLTLFTAFDQFIGTPAYVSPEQAEMSGLDIDTRSDIYSLGVLLYELLTGKTPFNSKELLRSGLYEMRRTLREREPHRPSTMVTTMQGEELKVAALCRRSEPPKLISMLRGDLDWIVMKALEKDRSRRYQTANGLAMDIDRHLNSEPVVARPPSRLYQFQKLVHRNKVIFAAAAAVAAALIVGLGTSTFLFFREREARRRAVAAEQQQNKLRQEAETREKITEAAFLVSQEKYQEADELMSKVSLKAPTVEGAAVIRSLGEWHALENQWTEAAARFALLLQIDELDGWDTFTLDYLMLGPALIEMGDTKRYEQFRLAAIARFTGTTYRVDDRIVKISLLLPADQTIIKSLVPMAEASARLLVETNDAGGDVFQAAWRSLSLALMEYRRGNYSTAVEWAHRCLGYPEYNAPRAATAHVILAMACHQQGQTEEARSELAQARQAIENKFHAGLERGTGVQGFWFDWVFGRILLREAMSLINVSSEVSDKAAGGR
jgi:serine/threonine protein kinase